MDKEIFIFNNAFVKKDQMSGSDKRVFEYMKIWDKKGLKSNLFIPSTYFHHYENYNADINYNAIKTININTFGKVLTYFYRAFKTIRKLPRLKKGNIVYSSSDFFADTIPAFYSKLKNKNLTWIAGLHLICPNPFKGFKNVYSEKIRIPRLSDLLYFLSQRFIISLFKHYADKVFVSNSIDRDFLLKKGFNSNKVLVTPGGVDLKETKGKQTKIFDSCFVGRFHPQKGLFDLISIWEKVCCEKKDAKLVIIGSGDLKTKLIEKIKEKDLQDNITLVGYKDGKDKYKIIQQSKVLLFPSTYESFGIVAVEAMACSIPVVAYDLPFYKDIFPKGMIRVGIKDINAFSSEITKIIKNPVLRKKLEKQAYSQAQKYSWENVANLKLNAINEINNGQ